MARARNHQTFIESLGVATGTGEKEGWDNKAGHRPERAEQVDSQGKLPPHEYTRYLA